MDKRDFIKAGVATIATGGVSGASAHEAMSSNFSIHSLEALKVKSRTASRMFAGSELTSLATSTAKNRLWFVADPVGFATAHQITVDRSLLDMLQPLVHELDGKFANQMTAVGLFEERMKSGSLAKSGDSGTALPLAAVYAAVQAASQVVTAVAAVVIAVSATYATTRWQIDVDPN